MKLKHGMLFEEFVEALNEENSAIKELEKEIIKFTKSLRPKNQDSAYERMYENPIEVEDMFGNSQIIEVKITGSKKLRVSFHIFVDMQPEDVEYSWDIDYDIINTGDNKTFNMANSSGEDEYEREAEPDREDFDDTDEYDEAHEEWDDSAPETLNLEDLLEPYCKKFEKFLKQHGYSQE